jgi:integrase
LVPLHGNADGREDRAHFPDVEGNRSRCWKYPGEMVQEGCREDRADKAMDEEMMKKFDGLTPHDLRHTFGSWKIEQGEDVVYVSKQMGHSKAGESLHLEGKIIRARLNKRFDVLLRDRSCWLLGGL